MGRLFGTDGVRGVANSELTPEMALQLGRAGAYVLTRERQNNAPKIILGMDTRLSGDMLEAALAAGLCSVGAQVYRAGVIPTPGIAYLVRKYNFDAGVMISASHNPMRDNGIKFFNADGYKLPDTLEDEIEFFFGKGNADLPRPIGPAVGVIRDCPEALDDYVAFLQSTVPGLRLEGIKIALDCANGATYQAAPLIFHLLGATVFTLHNEPDGENINAACGSTHMDSLREFVAENQMDVGLAFDGDGDRILCVDENGALVDGDIIMAICGIDMLRRGALKENTLVATVMSNMGLVLACRREGITLHQTAVGDRYVLEKMLEGDYSLGGEQSGHVIFRAYNTTGDGILTGLRLLSVLKQAEKPLSQLKQVMEVMPQVLVNARVYGDNKFKFESNPKIFEMIKAIETRLAGEGRVLVRPSGTEPLVRVMIEGRVQAQIDLWAHELAQLIEKELNDLAK